MPYELKSETVVVCGETLTVYQASNEMDVRRSFLIGEAQKPTADVVEGAGASYLYFMETLLYPSLVACTVGNLPTLDEYLHNIPAEESASWLAAAKRLNHRWFQYAVTPEEEEALLEKKEP